MDPVQLGWEVSISWIRSVPALPQHELDRAIPGIYMKVDDTIYVRTVKIRAAGYSILCPLAPTWLWSMTQVEVGYANLIQHLVDDRILFLLGTTTLP